MKRAYVLMPKNKVGKNDFERILYLEAKRVDVITPTSLMEAEEDEIDREWEELRGKIIKDKKGLDLEKFEPLEKVIELYFDIFERHFKEAGLYPAYCYLAVSLIWEIFTQLGYEVKVMKSKIFHHWFTEIVDKITGLTWIFDPTAEQFQEPFGDQYNSSRYEKNQIKEKHPRLIPTKTNLVGFLFLEGEDFPNRFCLKKADFNDNLDLWE